MSGIFVPNSVLPCFPSCSDDGAGDADDGVADDGDADADDDGADDGDGDGDDGGADDDEHGLHGGRMNVCSLLSCCKY